jgi:cobalt transport protein ATP-binding subunit
MVATALTSETVRASDTRATPAVEVRALEFAYPDGTRALCGVDVTIMPGEKVALIGPNGAGKSTFMLHLNGINAVQSGSVAIDGIVVDRRTAPRIRALVGLVFQDPDDQLFSPTVFDDVAFGPLYMGIASDEIERRVGEALAAVGLEGFEKKAPYHLSIGQRKRAALATVLSMEPSILVLDEPSAGLDPRGRRELINLLNGLPYTLLVSTHDMRFAADVFPRTLIMDGGTIVADGPTGDLLADGDLLHRHGLEMP